MNAETPQPDLPAGGSPPVDGASARKLVNPNLSGALTADYAALQNDLVQAQELAADFQRQLAGKSNEHAQLKQIFEKTQADLAHLQEGIVELRAERHRLANEAMRATTFQTKLAKVIAERDHLRIDLEVVRHALAVKADEMTIAMRDRDRRIAELAVEMVSLRQALAEAKGGSHSPAPADPTPASPQEETVEILYEAAAQKR